MAAVNHDLHDSSVGTERDIMLQWQLPTAHRGGVFAARLHHDRRSRQGCPTVSGGAVGLLKDSFDAQPRAVLSTGLRAEMGRQAQSSGSGCGDRQKPREHYRQVPRGRAIRGRWLSDRHGRPKVGSCIAASNQRHKAIEDRRQRLRKPGTCAQHQRLLEPALRTQR
jgi:hypothetical protein